VLVRAELRWPDAAGVELSGRTVLDTRAHGKHLLTRFDDGRTLHTHLRMDGRWKLHATGADARAERDPQVRALLVTDRWTAVGHRLGMLDVLRTVDEQAFLAHLGPDVLDDDFPKVGLPAVLSHWAQDSRPAAEVLLDQTVQAGFGTIWTAEALFARRIWPWAPATSITDPASLVMTGRELMSRSVRADPPRQVHGRAGKPCRRCSTLIRQDPARRPPRERPVFWCPVCQAAPSEPR
jgi:endonuclease VIII